MTLDILITRYNEPVKLLYRLLDSIKQQLCFDFNNLNVYIVNDGLENLIELPTNLDLPFKVTYFGIPKAGVSAARQAAFDKSSSDYVMFCDTDDFFCSTFGLATIEKAVLQYGTADLITSFLTQITLDNTFLFVSSDVLIHGNVFRRNFITANSITWDTTLSLYEDANFMIKVKSQKPVVFNLTQAYYCYDTNHIGSVTYNSWYTGTNIDSIKSHCDAIFLFADKTLDYLYFNAKYESFNKVYLNLIYVIYVYLVQLKLYNESEVSVEITKKLQKYYSKWYNNTAANIVDLIFMAKDDIFSNIFLDNDPLITEICSNEDNRNFCIANFDSWFQKTLGIN